MIITFDGTVIEAIISFFPIIPKNYESSCYLYFVLCYIDTVAPFVVY